MKKIYKIFAGMFSLFIISLLTFSIYADTSAVNTDESGHLYNYDANFKLFEPASAKQVQVQLANRRMVVPGGCPFGIKMHTRGVLVVGMSDIQNGTQNLNPAKDAGLKVGDLLTKINDMAVNRIDDAKRFIAECDGSEVKITAIRDNTEMDFYLLPIKSEYYDGYKAGIWLRDSSAGIGTMTFYDPETLSFGGLGHAICDVDTGEVMPLFSGEIVDVNISGVNIGQSGRPGELKGTFASERPLGFLYTNSEAGIFGVLDCPVLESDPVPMASRHEIQPGPAQILATVSGNKPQSFDIEIEKVNYSDTTHTKNMVIKIVDAELLSLSGGIVQGMSGSPILQNGRLVGAVTHVFVNDPTRGYGIFVENMEKIMSSVENGRLSA